MTKKLDKRKNPISLAKEKQEMLFVSHSRMKLFPYHNYNHLSEVKTQESLSPLWRKGISIYPLTATLFLGTSYMQWITKLVFPVPCLNSFPHSEEFPENLPFNNHNPKQILLVLPPATQRGTAYSAHHRVSYYSFLSPSWKCFSSCLDSV